MNDTLRVGHGIDVHKFAESYLEDKPLKLAGLTIPDNYSLLAHSDGDVVLHAICDAILGACAAGDIGQHFPITDEQFANADSSKLLEQVLQIANKNQMPDLVISSTAVRARATVELAMKEGKWPSAMILEYACPICGWTDG